MTYRIDRVEVHTEGEFQGTPLQDAWIVALEVEAHGDSDPERALQSTSVKRFVHDALEAAVVEHREATV